MGSLNLKPPPEEDDSVVGLAFVVLVAFVICFPLVLGAFALVCLAVEALH